MKAADKAACKGGLGFDAMEERPFLVANADVNPYPATPTMRRDGGWNAPLTTAHMVRMRADRSAQL